MTDRSGERSSRLASQIAFIAEIDKTKSILRQTVLMDASRRENDAEHSWHLAMMAILLQEYASERVDILKVIKMLLVHDIVEIDAGDTFAYDEAHHADKAERERKAADRIFYLLPDEQAREVDALWTEFEEGKTPEARFATSLDRFQPMLHNYMSEGHAWREHGIERNQVVERNRHIEAGAPELWLEALRIIEESVEKGYLRP